jgi:hypothetical protein
MKFQIALMSLLAATATAFSPRAIVTPNKNKAPEQHSALWRPPMNMVAGGAEKAYGQEYYDGTFP